MATPAGTNVSAPAMLLQYSYYLNQEATKCVNIGIDPYTFIPKMIIFSPTLRKGVNLTGTEWAYLHTSYHGVRDFLTYKKDRAWFSTNNIAVRSMTSKANVRLVKLRNNPSPSHKINLNLAEWEALKGLTIYLNALMEKFNQISPMVRDYYDSYIARCIENGQEYLEPHECFEPVNGNMRNFNSFRLFNEIPVLCEEKLYEDLYGARGYLTDRLNTE